MPSIVKKDVVVSIQYKLSIDDEMIEETSKNDPLLYLHGHENIVPGLETALEGLKVGDSKSVTITPEDGYGDFDPDANTEIPMDDLPEGFGPEEGMVIRVTDEEGEHAMAVITEIDEENNVMVIDFNHPLAGQTLHFDVTVTALRDATAEELDHGHVHDDDDHHHE